MIIDLGRPSEEIMLDNVNLSAKSQFSLDHITFGPPLEHNTDPRDNTLIDVHAIEGNGIYSGTRRCTYTRLALNGLFGDTFALVQGPIEDTSTAVTLVNRDYGLNIGLPSLVDQTADDEGYVQLYVTDDLIFLPRSSIKILDSFDYHLWSMDTIVHDDLFAALTP